MFSNLGRAQIYSFQSFQVTVEGIAGRVISLVATGDLPGLWLQLTTKGSPRTKGSNKGYGGKSFCFGGKCRKIGMMLSLMGEFIVVKVCSLS